MPAGLVSLEAKLSLARWFCPQMAFPLYMCIPAVSLGVYNSSSSKAIPMALF